MTKIKVICADYDLIYSSKHDENEDGCYERGVDPSNICICCGKEIKNLETAKQLHLIEGGSYFTEDQREINMESGSDMGWFFTGPSCYKKFLRNRKEVEITIE